MSSPFDRSLESQELSLLGEEYASRYGQRGTAAYRRAWLEFRRRVRTTGDLGRLEEELRPFSTETIALMEAAIDRAMAKDGAPMATAQLVDPQGQLRIVVQSGLTPEFLKFFEIAEETGSACGRARHAGRPVWVADVGRSPIFAGLPARDVILAAGCRAVASVPIASASGHVVGVISIHHRHPVRWNQQRRAALQAIAQATGRALERRTARGGPAERPAADS